MAVDAARAGLPTRGVRLRLSAIFWRRPWLKAAALLAPPVLGFVGVYLSSLVVLFVSAFWSIDSFSGKLLHVWTLDNFKQLFSTSDSTYWRITGRTVGIAGAVTLTDALLAFPFAYYMARIASRRMRTFLFLLVLLPLWSSYLVRICSWTTILRGRGVLNWSLNRVGVR